MTEHALCLANGLLRRFAAKTTHGMIRGPSRWPLSGVVDPDCAGQDAGEVLDGRPRGIPVFGSVPEALRESNPRPTVCVLGVATPGGVMPDGLRESLLAAAAAGMTLVNGLHRYLSDDVEIVAAVERAGGRILDVRRPRPPGELRFWTGESLALAAPRLAVLGTDCAMGKRTTCLLLRAALRERGVRAEMIYTGQTGWLQGIRHGFILDATLNDFVCGEMERAVLECARELQPELILLEGQSGLRNPSGPCGSEFLLGVGAKGVVLQHSPGRRFFKEQEHLGHAMPPVESEIELIRSYGSEVVAVTLHEEKMADEALEAVRARLERALGIPVARPLKEGLDRVAAAVAAWMAREGEA